MVDACPVLYNVQLTACFCFSIVHVVFCTTSIGLFAFLLHTASSNAVFVKTDLFKTALQKHNKSRHLTQNKGFLALKTPIPFGNFKKAGKYVAGVG